MANQGGSREQHVKAGQQSHKNDGNRQMGGNQRGGQQQQAEDKNTKQQGGQESGQRGGSHEQHVKAGQQSHKNR